MTDDVRNERSREHTAGVQQELAAALAEARRQRGWSTRVMAQHLTDEGDFPVRHQRVSAYERGTLPSEDYCAAVERVLELEPGLLQTLWRAERAQRLAPRGKGDSPAGDTRSRRPSRLVLAIVGGLAVLGAIVGGLFIAFTGGGDDDNKASAGAAEGSEKSCVVGEGIPEYTTLFARTFRRAGGATEQGCPLNAVHPWGAGVIQDLRGGPHGHGAIMALTPDYAVVLNGATWAAYEKLGGPGNTAPLAGYPVTVNELCRKSRLMQLQGGTAGPGGLLHRTDKGSWVWVYGQIWTRYVALGGPDGRLGLPKAPARDWEGGLRQDFDHGWLYFSDDRGALTGREYAADQSRAVVPPVENSRLPPELICRRR